MEHFCDRLKEQMDSKRSQVVVGLDPRLDRIPEGIVREARRAHADASAAAGQAIRLFNEQVIDCVSPHVVAVKCQIAFYERWGLEGIRAYSQTLACARDRGLIVIGDVKRGDIGSTAEAYAAAHLGAGEGDACEGSGELAADAVTINPYFGYDGVAPFLERASRSGGGIFALVKTSNPSSADIQDLTSGGRPLYERVGQLVESWGEPYRGKSGYSLLGAVVGATYAETLRRLREAMPHTFFLVPGFGAQGAGIEDVLGAFDRRAGGAVVSSSRAIIYAFERGPHARNSGQRQWQQAVRQEARAMKDRLWRATH